MENHNLETKKLEILQEQLAVHRVQDERASMLLIFAMVLTFLLYFMFEKHLFLGDAVTWDSYFETWHGAADFILMFIIVVMSALFLAWVKHHAYLHFGLYGSIGLIVVTVIGFALFAEFFSSSASQDTKSRVLLQNDKAYQATIAQPNTAPTQFIGGSHTEIAKAEQTYARCMANLGKPGYRHCNGDKANLDSLKAQESTRLSIARDVAIQSNIETEKLRNERQDKLKADSYNPVIVSIAKFLAAITGGSYTDFIKMATVLVTLIVAVAFEILHHFLSHAKERAQNAVYGLELELAKYAGYSAPEKPESVLPKNDGAFKQSGIGFTAPIGKPTTAQHPSSPNALFRYQEHNQATVPTKSQGFGFIPNRQETDKTVSTPSDSAQIRKADDFCQSPEQLQRVYDLAADTTGQTWREALKAGDSTARDMPLDARIQPPSPTKAAKPAPAEQLGIPSDQNTQPPLGIPSLDNALQVVADDLYPSWKTAVKRREITPAKDPGQKFIWKATANQGEGKQVLSAQETARIWETWQERAADEGVLRPNPKYQPGNRQPKYIIN